MKLSRQPLLPYHLTNCGHGLITPPAGLQAAREKLKTQKLKCGNCKENFSAICALHLHLNGDSYHYDKETKTAYPLDENSCPALRSGKKSERISAGEAYFTESGQRVTTLLKHKKRQSKSAAVIKRHSKPDKIINIQVYPEENDNAHESNAEADPANVDLEFSNLAPQKEVPVNAGGRNVKAEGDGENDMISGDGETPKDTDKEEMGIIGEENTTETDQKVGLKSEIPVGTEEPVEDFPVEETIAATPDGLYNSDQQNLMELQNEGVETQTPLVINKQMVIDLHSMETNEDGSLKIVVGEQDAAIFRTPQGEEILKALKAQGKGMMAKNTQIIYNYSVPVAMEGSGPDALAASDTGVPLISDSLARSGKQGIDFDGYTSARKKARSAKKSTRQDDEGEELVEGIDGLKPVVFMKKEEKLTTAEALNILNECNLGMHDDKISKIQPLSAKGGEVYVIDLEALPNRQDNRHDKYVWYNCGAKRYPKNDELIKKIVFKIRLPNQSFSDGFMKSIFEWLDEKERYCIVHYTGFESLFKPFPHGNCKTGKNFVRTCRSVIEELKEMANQQDDLSPNDVHKQIKTLAPAGLRNLRTPRNLDQIKNHFFYQKKRKRELAMQENS